MDLHMLIISLGIIAYTCLILTVITGVLNMKYHVKWVKLKMHIVLGILTFIVVSMHAGVVIYLNREISFFLL